MSQVAIAESDEIWRPMMRLAAPVMAEETLMLLVGYTDWWLTGRFLEGPEPKAAMSLMSYTMWLLPSLFAAISIGATAVVSRRIGERRPSDANRAANQAFLVGGVVAVFATAIAFLAVDHFPRWMQLSDESSRLASEYFWIVSWALPLIMAEQVIAACLRGAGDTMTGFLAKTMVVVVNLIVSTGLVTGWGPFPELGWKGLAIGTACGHCLGGGLLLAAVIFGRSGLKLSRRQLRPKWEVIRLLLRVGLPGGVDIAALLGCQFVFVGLINRMGDQAAAAHGLAVQIEALAYMPGSAFQVAAATIAGQLLGAGRLRQARRGAVACLVAGGLVMCTAGLVFAYAGDVLTQLFLGGQATETGKMVAGLLQIVGAAMPALAICMIGAGTLRGAGDTRWPLAITLFGFCVVRIPLAIVLGWSPSTTDVSWLSGIVVGLGVQGAWFAMIIDLVLRAILISGRLAHGGWQHIRLHP